jgi:putative redox protein
MSVMLTATSRSVPGTLRQELLIDGRHHLVTDEPEAVGGDGSAPAPHELFPAALASCISTTLVMYSRTKGWDLGEVEVDVSYDNHSTPRRFEITIRLDGDLRDDQLARLEKVAAACPVRKAVESGVVFKERIELPRTTRRLSRRRLAVSSSNGRPRGLAPALRSRRSVRR